MFLWVNGMSWNVDRSICKWVYHQSQSTARKTPGCSHEQDPMKTSYLEGTSHGKGPVLDSTCGLFSSPPAQTSPGVGGWAYPLWKMMEWKSVGMMKFPIYGKIKNVPNWNQWLCSAMNCNNHIWGKELLRMMLGHIGSMIHRVSARATSPTYVLFTSNLAAR